MPIEFRMLLENMWKKQDDGTRKLVAAGERAHMCRCIASLTDQ